MSQIDNSLSSGIEPVLVDNKDSSPHIQAHLDINQVLSDPENLTKFINGGRLEYLMYTQPSVFILCTFIATLRIITTLDVTSSSAIFSSGISYWIITGLLQYFNSDDLLTWGQISPEQARKIMSFLQGTISEGKTSLPQLQEAFDQAGIISQLMFSWKTGYHPES